MLAGCSVLSAGRYTGCIISGVVLLQGVGVRNQKKQTPEENQAELRQLDVEKVR